MIDDVDVERKCLAMTRRDRMDVFWFWWAGDPGLGMGVLKF